MSYFFYIDFYFYLFLYYFPEIFEKLILTVFIITTCFFKFERCVYSLSNSFWFMYTQRSS